MPWIPLAAAAVSAAPALIGGSKGAQGPRNINWTSAQADPWNLQARDESLAAQGQQQNFVNQLQGQNGVGNQSMVFGQQQALAGQLQNQANGTGPNPVQAQLAQNTAQNIGQQASLQAGQRGASSNVGLMSRNIGQQGANIQQQSVGQAATLGAQQQLAAQQALMQQQGMMGNLAGQQVGQLQTGVQNQVAATQNQQGMQLQNLQNWNTLNANAAQGASTNSVEYAKQNMQQNAAAASGIGAGMAGSASLFGKSADKMNILGSPSSNGTMVAYNGGMIGGNSLGYANGGPVSCYGQALKGMNMKSGGAVAGKAQVKGDSPKNDTVPAVLSPGEIVIPRSVLSGPNASSKAKAFVEAILAKHGKR